MSLALDIVKAAYEKASALADAHAQRIGETAEEFRKNMADPWRFRVEALRERREALASNEKEETES